MTTSWFFYQPGPYGCMEYAKVLNVGGCDKRGDCGVMLDNGKFKQNVRQPVVGQTVCSHFRGTFGDR